MNGVTIISSDRSRLVMAYVTFFGACAVLGWVIATQIPVVGPPWLRIAVGLLLGLACIITFIVGFTSLTFDHEHEIWICEDHLRVRDRRGTYVLRYDDIEAVEPVFLGIAIQPKAEARPHLDRRVLYRLLLTELKLDLPLRWTEAPPLFISAMNIDIDVAQLIVLLRSRLRG